MADERPNTTPKSVNVAKPQAKRPSKGFRKYLRQQKQNAGKPLAS